MGKINGCLKCLFIFFNILFAIIGCVLIYGAAKASSINQQVMTIGGPNLGWAWVFAIGVLGISCLGIYAGFSEKDLALKIFAGFMGVGMLIMLIFGIIIVVTRNKVKTSFESSSSELVKALMQEEGMRAGLDALQQSAQCCGFGSASDWGDEIPSSCSCDQGSGYRMFGGSGCKNKPQGTSGPNKIFSQSCSGIIFSWVNILFQVAMGFFFGFAVTALLGLLVSLLMIHQVKRHDSAGGASIAMKGY